MTQRTIGPTPEHVTYDQRGKLDEVFVTGSAHLERMDQNRWFLSMTRKDGTSTAIWFEGKVTLTEERG